MYKNPKFQQLSPEKQTAIKSHLYDKYLSPIMQQHGMMPPLKEHWLHGTGDTQNFGGSDEQKKDRLNIFAMEGMEQFARMSLFGSKLIHTTALFEGHVPFLKQFSPLLKREGDLLEAGSKKILDKTNEWKGDHYSEIMEHRVASTAGEIAGQLPLYSALGGMWSGAGITDELLAKTPVGKWVGGKLVNAADGYLSTKVLGGSNREAATNAAMFPVGEAGLGFVQKQATKYIGKLLSLGGRKLVQESFAKTAATPTSEATEVLRGKRNFVVQKLTQANQSILDSLASESFGQKYSELGASAKEEITKQLSKITDKAEKQVVVHGADVVEAKISKDIEKEAKKNPKAKLTPETIKAVTKQVVDKAKIKSEIIDPIKAITKIALPRDLSGAKPNYGYGTTLFKTNLSDKDKALYIVATKGSKADPRYVDYLKKLYPDKTEEQFRQMGSEVKARLKAEAKIKAQDEEGNRILGEWSEGVRTEIKSKDKERIVPGGANPRSLEFAINAANKYAPKLMMKLEGVQNKLLFAYSISSPKDKKFIISHLKDEFPDDSVKQINNRVKVLWAHIQEMRLSGHLPPEDERGVFRSTKTAGDKSKWQEELKQEVAQMNGKLKNYPSAQAALKAINKLIESEDEIDNTYLGKN